MNQPRVIIIEDEPLIALMIEQMADDLGWPVIGSAHTEASAFRLLDDSAPDIALMDIHLGLATSLAVASACKDRNIPVIFITRFAPKNVPPQCEGSPVLSKPFTADQLRAAFDQVAKR